MTDDLLLGVDVGTTSVKAVVFDGAGTPVAAGRAPNEWRSTAGHTETTAERIRDAALHAITEAVSGAPAGRIAGIGIASIAESGVLLDGDGRSVGPVIAWHDRRDEAELRELTEDLGADRFRETTGLPLWQQWSLTKSRWLARHVPETREAVRRLNVAEWIALSLGAAPVTEASLASRTGWFDIHAGDWWDDGLGFAGVEAELLPELARGGDALGAVSHPDLPAALRGARITVAGHDHQVASVGLGMWDAGDVFDSSGTAEALVRTSRPGLDRAAVGRLAAGGITVGWHALSDRWCLLGATEGGLMLGRVLRTLGVSDVSSGLDDDALALPESGVRVTTDDDGSVRIDRIGDEATPAAVWRAATEEASRQAGSLAERMAAESGLQRRVLSAGGWTASTALLAAKRRFLGDVSVSAAREAGARGAALFAGVAAGLWPRVEESAFAPVAAESTSVAGVSVVPESAAVTELPVTPRSASRGPR